MAGPPATDAPTRHPGGPPQAADGGRELRLLLVEDDAGDALLLRELLADSGLPAAVTWVRTLAAARAALPAGADCVLLDLHLPDGRGLAALPAVLDAAPDVPLIVVTGLHDEAAGAGAVAAGAQDYLVKGQIDTSTLARAVRYAVERKRAESATVRLLESQRRAAENARLERGLLPEPIVRDPALRVAVRYQPGRQRALLGGDFYDLVQQPDGTVRALVGDVSGHGPDEAAVGVCLRICWRTAVLAGLDDLAALDLLDQVLRAERPTPQMYTTVCLTSIDADRAGAAVLCAGHPPPLLLDGGAAAVALRHQPPVGLLRGPVARRPGTRIALPPGAELLLYTDGLVDGRVGDGDERLGIDGLAGIVSLLHQRETRRPLVDAVVDAVTAADGGRLADDLALVHVRWSA
ncbi:serine/threonine phosphatase [Pilimelia terevasa]|uniref:Serine/threonine phosphatase n=1 Tax=Pilimelia terevasa TaxID=53372 RepID=A0A8J3BNZ5_9ACTN|nr:SpoIIE family protein phosphatase [Pilimelia terevasa]GGK28221.1 serine/threonine phosphatase [Pilimelia terevasa]